MAAKTIPARLFEQARSRPNAPAYYVRTGGAWKVTPWKTYADEVRTAARAMVSLGLEAGQTVAILGFNRPEWAIFDLAAMCVGAAPAGIYTTCSPPEVQYIIDHAEAPLVLLEDEGQWEKVKAERDNLPKVKHVIMMKGCPAIDDELVMSWEEFLSHAVETDDSVIDERIDALEDDALATFIYTSGTTGPPKGVMLSNRNLAWTASCACDIVGLGPNDTNLSYLPLSHIAEQVFTLHGPITAGSAVYFAESIAAVPDNLKEVQPTIFFGVPRIWEKFHAGITGKLKEATGVKAALVNWARGVGTKTNALRNKGQSPSGLLALQYKLANKLIFSKLKPAVGLGNVRVCVTGAAPIASEILEFFASLDITVQEVYGQSEGTGPSTFNVPGNTRFGTVGTQLPGGEVKTTEEDEIIVRGPNIFLGYFKDPEATAKTLIDGWLYSGDLGKIDSDGFLTITGRKKEIIITAGGKNIAPKNIEAAIKNHEIVSQAVVIGDRRKYLTALVTLEPESAAAFAKEHGLPASDLHTNPKVLDSIDDHMKNVVNPQFARVEQIKKFRILNRDLSIEDGELTPTLKVKRNVVHKHFADTIEAMYAE